MTTHISYNHCSIKCCI